MSGSTHWKRLMSCLLLGLVIFGCHYYVLNNTQAPQFLRAKFSILSSPLLSFQSSRSRNGPLHVLLLSYARTGSSFLGDLLQSHPRAFYHFEPLHFLSSPVINGSFYEALNLLHRLFSCSVTRLPGFLQWQRRHLNYMKLKRSSRFWKACTATHSCYNASYIDAFCSNHSVRIIKTIRLGLRQAAQLYAKFPKLNLKIIYLVRDPRGTLNSRKKHPISSWCRKDPVCSNPQEFCRFLDDDLNVTCSLLSSRPDSFILLRYEDLSQNPFAETKRLIDFLGLPGMPPEMEAFLKTHTALRDSRQERSKLDGLEFSYSTFRNSSATSVRWRQETSLTRTINVQRACHQVLEKLGYHFYSTSGALRSNVNFDNELKESINKACSEK